MANAVENPSTGGTYLEYFELARPPFASLPGPVSIYHAEQYSLLMTQLAAAVTETDRLVVLRGAGGSGKTTLLNRFLGGLDEETSFASLDETCTDAVAFHCSFLRQIGFGSIDGKLGELQTITRQFLVNRAAAGDTVLLVVDNAHLIRPAVLDQLRWLAGIEHRARRVLSVILAGKPELRGILDSPAMSDLDFRMRNDFHIRAYTSEETAEYIQYRLSLAGGDGKVSISAAAHALLYRFTGGIPRLINRVCTSILAEACRRQVTAVDDALVRAVAEAEQLPINVVAFKGRGRRKTDSDYAAPLDDTDPGERIRPREAAAGTRRERIAASRVPDVEVARLFDQIAALSAELGKLKAERAAAQQMLDSQNLNISELRDTLAAQTAEADSLARTAQDSTQEIARLRGQLQDERKVLADCRQQLERQEGELTGLREQLDDEKRHARAARSRATRARNRVAKLEEIKAALEVATRDLRAELEEASRRVRDLSGANEQLEESEAAREALEAGMAELEELRETIEKKDAHIDALKSELAEFVAGNTETQARLAEAPQPVPAEITDDDGGEAEEIVAIEIMRLGRVEQVCEIADPDGRIMIGRSEDSDLRLDSEFVSRHHALLFCTPGHTYIEDLNSFNGTIVNGKSVTRCRIRPDDTIIVGDFRVRPLASL